MAAMTFASKLKEDGSFTIPQEAVESLGLHPGDEIQVRIETGDDIVHNQAYYEGKLAEFLEEAKRLKPEPGKQMKDPHEAAFGEMLKEKYRKQGFNL